MCVLALCYVMYDCMYCVDKFNGNLHAANKHLIAQNNLAADCHLCQWYDYKGYRIAGNFRRTKFSRTAPKMKICGYNSRGCWPESRDRTARMPNSRKKFLRMLGQPQNLRKFHPVKISRYTVVPLTKVAVRCQNVWCN